MAAGMSDVSVEDYTAQLKGAKAEVDKIIDATNANPIMVRLGWHDSGTHDASISEAWPKSGGAIGSIRFKPEVNPKP
jgi:L-ascorbate peroxidase